MLKFLYGTRTGRILLRPLVGRKFSELSGKLMDTSVSRLIIPRFIKRNNIDMNEYEEADYSCFNDFFTRKVKSGLRKVDMRPEHIISPCDGLLRCYEMQDDKIISIKQSEFTLSSLLRNDQLADEFRGGTALVFRLCVNHYHRYCYIDNGVKGENIHIDGIYHTVRPLALSHYPVFTENAREYTVIDTENHGKIVQMEVGAMLVGKIQNYRQEGVTKRGEEKGKFLYGGSTIILLIKRGVIRLTEKVSNAYEEEVSVKMGEQIGINISTEEKRHL